MRKDKKFYINKNFIKIGLLLKINVPDGKFIDKFFILQDSNLSFLKQISAIFLKNPIFKLYKTTKNYF